jgi:hypothetical protein
MPFQENANVTRLPCTRTMPVALPLGSPTGGLPGTCTSCPPSSFASRKTGLSRARWIAADRSGAGAVALAGAAWPWSIPDMSMPGMAGAVEGAGWLSWASAGVAGITAMAAPTRPSPKVRVASAKRGVRIFVSFRDAVPCGSARHNATDTRRFVDGFKENWN